MPTTNTFYIAANIIFDLATGDARNVLMLVNKPEDASIFSRNEAQNYIKLISARASKIGWEIEPVVSMMTPVFGLPTYQPESGRFIIKGVPYV